MLKNLLISLGVLGNACQRPIHPLFNENSGIQAAIKTYHFTDTIPNKFLAVAGDFLTGQLMWDNQLRRSWRPNRSGEAAETFHAGNNLHCRLLLDEQHLPPDAL